MGRPKKIIHPPIESVQKSMEPKPEWETKPAIEETKQEEPEFKPELLESEAEKLETQPENKPVDKIFEKYQEKVNEISDINELLPYIYEIAKECETCVEFGVRRPTTTYALLAAKPKRLVSYDIGRYDEEVSEVERLCAEAGQDFQFILQDILKIEIEETDLIMSDAFHSRSFVEKELQLHAHKAKKYMIFHDWVTYGDIGENPYNDETSPYGAGLGIKHAIEPFLASHPEWVKHQELLFNNGLLILKRI